MKFLQDLRTQRRRRSSGTHRCVATRVRFMTGNDYKNYKLLKTYTYHGGLSRNPRSVSWCRSKRSGTWWWRKDRSGTRSK
ncbi:MAG: DUF1883 domain-containing protein [Flavobacteriales bacterium]|nr:DUF1883 domain-containing protein [Flavobacteriales bacterium]